jgi:hypothetical protein
MNAVRTLPLEMVLRTQPTASTPYASVAPESVRMAGVLDDLWSGIKSVGQGIGSFVTQKGPCVAACGIDALRCITCGTNASCWIKCAGPQVFPCIARCINT